MKPYRHKLKREDVDTGTMLIEKSAWASFPPTRQEFAVEAGGGRFATRIVAEDCSYRPPAHQHLHVAAGHFRAVPDFSPDAAVEIGEADDTYQIRNG
jgi:hypothetical protein